LLEPNSVHVLIDVILMMLLLLALLPSALALVHQVHDATEVRPSHGLVYDRLSLLLENRSEFAIPFYPCDKHPHMCQPPFNCQTCDMNQLSHLAVDGHANLQFWCRAPRYVDTLVKHCLVNKDLKTSASEVFKMDVRQHYADLDASYCFLEGHCTNEAVTDDSTVEDAEKLCDKRYGHEGWAGRFVFADMGGAAITWARGVLEGKKGLLSAVASKEKGICDQKVSRLIAKLSCAAGNFHCDVQFCKHTVCGMDEYKKKYGHLAPRVPGHEIVDKSAF